MKYQQMKGLKATLDYLALLNPQGILIFGKDEINDRTFCQPISMMKARLKLLSCTQIEIRGIGFFTEAEAYIVAWLKAHIRLPPGRQWWNLCSPSQWLRYNFAQDLYIMHLSIAKKHYYICMRRDYVIYYRQKTFRNE